MSQLLESLLARECCTAEQNVGILTGIVDIGDHATNIIFFANIQDFRDAAMNFTDQVKDEVEMFRGCAGMTAGECFSRVAGIIGIFSVIFTIFGLLFDFVGAIKFARKWHGLSKQERDHYKMNPSKWRYLRWTVLLCKIPQMLILIVTLVIETMITTSLGQENGEMQESAGVIVVWTWISLTFTTLAILIVVCNCVSGCAKCWQRIQGKHNNDSMTRNDSNELEGITAA